MLRLELRLENWLELRLEMWLQLPGSRLEMWLQLRLESQWCPPHRWWLQTRLSSGMATGSQGPTNNGAATVKIGFLRMR